VAIDLSRYKGRYKERKPNPSTAPTAETNAPAALLQTAKPIPVVPNSACAATGTPAGNAPTSTSASTALVVVDRRRKADWELCKAAWMQSGLWLKRQADGTVVQDVPFLADMGWKTNDDGQRRSLRLSSKQQITSYGRYY
jgi:hypothetical protein